MPTPFQELVLTICFYSIFYIFFKIRPKGISPWIQFIREHGSQLRSIGAILMTVLFIYALLHQSGVMGKAYIVAVTLYAVRHFSEVGFRTYIGNR